jgi:ParB family transcriptional regulator, chromosome partitioning protein
MEMIPVALIDDPEFNSRVDADTSKIKALALTIPTPDKLLQPITVEKVSSRYLLVAGSRRLAAARLNGHTEIKANVRPESDTLTRMSDNFVENQQREDLTLYEKARWIAAFREKGAKGMDISHATGLSRQHVSNLAGMFERLPAEIHADWRAGHKAATLNILARIAALKAKTPEKLKEEQLARWATVKKLTEKYEAKIDPSEDDEDETTAKKKKSNKEQDDAPFKVPNQRFFDLIQAVKRSKLPGGNLAIACMKALVGETNKVKDVWDADAGTQATQ